MIRQFLLLLIVFLVSQSGVATTVKFTEHQYDANYIVLSEGIYGYDISSNPHHCCHTSLSVNAQNRAFLAFASDFVAAKSVAKIGASGGKGVGKGFSNKIKDQARAESRDTCVFCGTKTTRQPGPTRSEIDHAIPKSRNGNNSLDNAQNTCRTCNRRKGAKTTEEFLQ